MKSPTLVSLEGDRAEWEKFCSVIAVVDVRGEEQSVCDLH